MQTTTKHEFFWTFSARTWSLFSFDDFVSHNLKIKVYSRLLESSAKLFFYYRDFMWNNLTGSIPKEIGKMSSLVLL